MFKVKCYTSTTVNSEMFANSVKRHICNVKIAKRHDLPISVNDRVISRICEGLIFTKTSHIFSRKLNSRENFRNFQRRMNVDASTYESTVIQRCFDVVCLLGL